MLDHRYWLVALASCIRSYKLLLITKRERTIAGKHPAESEVTSISVAGQLSLVRLVSPTGCVRVPSRWSTFSGLIAALRGNSLFGPFHDTSLLAALLELVGQFLVDDTVGY
jgi:hypothetical protein